MSLDISRAHKRKSWNFWSGLLDAKLLQNFHVNAGDFQASSFVQLLLSHDLSDNVICNAAIYADNITYYFQSDLPSNPLQQRRFVSELENDPLEL